jgi:hypothetical protein
MSIRHRAGLAGVVLAGMALCGADLRAAPFRPTSDDAVIERLPVASPLQTATHAAGTRRQVRELIQAARATGDPRYYGRAEALLRAAPSGTIPADEALVLQATIDQALHRFDVALARLDEVLERHPMHAQARLTRATVLQVRGRLDEAARDCAMLARVARPLVATTCSAGIASLRGRGAAARTMLDQALRSAGTEPREVVAWSRAVLAGIAEREGDARVAAVNYAAVLALDPDDAFARAAWADLLLDAGDAAGALRLTAGRRSHDGLLLREALALQQLDEPGRAQAVGELAARFSVARRRKDLLHLREEARFELHLRGDADHALVLARRNWQVQREPADARILLEASIAAADREQEKVARAWYRAAGIVIVGDGNAATGPHPVQGEGR